ncbi:G protein-regulated inducer of neurite outgrowth 1 [Pelobates fuscus]|uniref:G protein-regulated inducer of neurite outgrowth 1 n=1 Tax=Pelobates fuscus TaxID=191477 RepID=UPI002FE45C2B
MGSPKELQRLQLSKPDVGSESISLRSPISSRIWQAEDPTRHLGFTGEDVSMRNFCASVHGDNDFMEGSFSFDTEGESFLAAQRDNSVDTVLEVQEEQMSLKQHDCSTDLSRSGRSLAECAFTPSRDKEIAQTDFKTSKDVLECTDIKQDSIKTAGISCESIIYGSKVTGEKTHCESVPEGERLHIVVEPSSELKTELSTETRISKNKTSHTNETGYESCMPSAPDTSISPSNVSSSVEPAKATPQLPPHSGERKEHSNNSCANSNAGTTMNTCKVSGSEGQNPLDGTLSDTPKQDKENISNEKKHETSSDGNKGCKETAGWDNSTKTQYCEQVTPRNNISAQSNKVEYRSIAVSPIIPPGSGTSFTFHSGVETIGTSSDTNSHNVGTANHKEQLPKTYSFELTPPSQEVSADTTVQFRSIAVSPIIPPDGSESFTFQPEPSSQSTISQHGFGTDQRTDKTCVDSFPKTCSFELTPPSLDVGTETRVECKSVAVSPIIPPDGTSFTFQTLKSTSNVTPGAQNKQSSNVLSKTYSSELTPINQDVGTQADNRVECVSVAVSPIIPPDGSPSFIFQSEQKHQEIGMNIAGKAGENESISSATNLQHQKGTTEMQNQTIRTRAQCVSVAVSPIVPPDGASSFTFHTEKDTKDIDNLSKTYSFELTPPDEDARTGKKVEYRSVAVSPIVPPGESSFTFQTEKQNMLPKTCSVEITPPSQDIGTQANKVECVSVAVSPFVLPQESSTFTFQTKQTDPESSALPEAKSLQLKPQSQDVGVQVDISVLCTSVAVSPFVPLDGSCSFIFQTEAINQGASSLGCSNVKPSLKDAEMQVSIRVETKSVATDPMTPTGKSPHTSYPEVRVKDPKGDHPEPVREVSWDEKGMTWEVYGASMEVEVLGMAIQKHLEKQIEEHGRQKVMTPQNTRGSSVRGTTVKSETKRQPNAFRSCFSHRKPRCCSRSAPAVE